LELLLVLVLALASALRSAPALLVEALVPLWVAAFRALVQVLLVLASALAQGSGVVWEGALGVVWEMVLDVV